MKKRYYLYSLLATATLTLAGCDYNEDNFPGFDELAVPTDIGNDTLTLAATDYQAIADLQANKDLALNQDPEGETAKKALEAVGTNKYFTESAPAVLYLPAYIETKYPYFDNGSKVTVFYDNFENLPAYLEDFNGTTDYQLDSDDYTLVWGSGRTVNYLTPSTVNQIPNILKESISNPKNGEMRMVSYAYSDTEPATGGGDEPAETYKKISEILSTGPGTYDVEGTVVATYARGFMLGDETGSILVYLNATANYSVGDLVTVSGNVTEHGGMLQFGNSSTINFTGRSETFAYPQATAMSVADLKAWKEAPEVEYVSITGELSISDNFYNIILNDPDIQGSISYPVTGLVDASLNGQEVTVTGYLIGTASGGKYINMMATSVVAAGTTSEYSPIGVVALSQAGEYSVKGMISATYERGFLINDGTGSILVYLNKQPAGYAIGDVVAVSGKTSEYAGLMQFGNSSTVETVSTGGEFTYPATRVLLGEDMDAYAQAPYIAYVSYEGTLTIDGNHYNVEVEGASNTVGSLSYPSAATVPASLNGKKVIVTGYVIGVTGSGRYVNTMAVSVEEATATKSAALALTRARVTPNTTAVYTYNGTSWRAYSTDDADIAVLQPADYTQIGYSYISKPGETLPIYLKKVYPYAKTDDVAAVVYVADDKGTITATEFKFDGIDWIETVVAQRTSIVFLKSEGTWIEAKVYYTASLLNGEDGGFTTQDIKLDGLNYVWSLDDRYGWKASGYADQTNKTTESWLISPQIDLSKAAAPVVKFDVAVNFLKKNTVDHYFTMEISTDYNGDVSQATWTKVEGIQWPAGDSWTFYTIEGADISSFAGQKVYIAFHYKSDKDTALTVEIQNLSVQE